MKKLTGLAKERPLVTLAGAVAVGALLGSFVFRHAGRLAFLAAASVVVSELWKSEGSSDVRALLERMVAEE